MGSHPAKTLERDPVHGPYDKALMKRGELARRLILEGKDPEPEVGGCRVARTGPAGVGVTGSARRLSWL